MSDAFFRPYGFMQAHLMEKHRHHQKQQVFRHYPDEISSKGLTFRVMVVGLVQMKGGVPVDSPGSYSPLTPNFCSQKLIIAIDKCEKYCTIKTLVVVKLRSSMRCAYDTDMFSISSCIAFGKLPSRISLINNLLSFLLITGYFHIIRSKNLVDSFA